MNDVRPVRVYILNFWVQGVNLGALNQYLHDSVDVIAYWNYIPLVYCIKSRLAATELTYKLMPFFPHGFMVAEVNTWNMNGTIPREAWDWFYLDHHEKGRPPAPVSGLGALTPFGHDPLSPGAGLGALGRLLKKPE
jgi:hypothetical protein